MHPGNRTGRSALLSVLATIFIAGYFLLFSYDSLNTYFTFDDGLNIIHLHRLWEIPQTAAVIDSLKVFTSAYRPLGALFYRVLYQLYGFNPLPFRVAAYFLLLLNVVLAYRFARALEATPEAASLSTLLFCYNASMIDLFYNTGTIYDLLCFPFYIGAVLVYVAQRSRGKQLSPPVMAALLLLFLAALDSKETAATLPAALLLYEILFRFRDYPSVRSAMRTGAFLLAMFGLSAVYMKIKVAELGDNPMCHPTITVPFILKGTGRYLDQLFYLKADSIGPVMVTLLLIALLGISAALRSRAIAYGTLFFGIAILPLSVINTRSGYAAYVAWPGLTLAMGGIFAGVRERLVRLSGRKNLQAASMVALFLCVALASVACFTDTRQALMSYMLWDQQRRIDFFTLLKREIPELPPNARILVLDDPWGPDWAHMFLSKLMYHDPTLWMDRLKNKIPVGDRDTYDLLVNYQPPKMGTTPSRIFGVRKSWETHWIVLREGEFTVSVPSENRAIRNIEFSPAAARTGRMVTVTVPELSNVPIDAIYRIVSNGKATAHTAENWCTLDGKGSCTLPAPHAEPVAVMSIDWIRPVKGRWIFTNGVLPLAE